VTGESRAAGGRISGAVVYHGRDMAEAKPAVLSAAATAALFVETAERVRPNLRLIGLLALGHLVIDVNQGALSAVLPFVKTALGLSYAQVGTLVFVSMVTSSVVQPVFGYLADRAARGWLLPIALTLAGAGIALTGIATGYQALLALIVLMGFGVAAYHPEGYRAATGVAGDRKATALSWFSLGGNIGYASGPLVAGMLIGAFGLAGTLGLFVPSALMTLAIVAMLPSMSRASGRERAESGPARGVTMHKAMALLVGIGALRSWSSMGFATFVPFYFVDYLETDARLVGAVLFVFLGSGAVGTVLAGPIADRWGARALVRWAFLAVIPFGVLFLLADGLVLRLIALGCFGALLTSTFSVSVVLGQAYLPRNAGMASGLMVGLAMGTGGLAVSLLGWMADRWGVPAALWVSALLPVTGFVAAQFLPAPRDREIVGA
jgi:MFS transporter, FSR family, fosmidomycin resistance protein